MGYTYFWRFVIFVSCDDLHICFLYALLQAYRICYSYNLTFFLKLQIPENKPLFDGKTNHEMVSRSESLFSLDLYCNFDWNNHKVLWNHVCICEHFPSCLEVLVRDSSRTRLRPAQHKALVFYQVGRWLHIWPWLVCRLSRRDGYQRLNSNGPDTNCPPSFEKYEYTSLRLLLCSMIS